MHEKCFARTGKLIDKISSILLPAAFLLLPVWICTCLSTGAGINPEEQQDEAALDDAVSQVNESSADSPLDSVQDSVQNSVVEDSPDAAAAESVPESLPGSPREPEREKTLEEIYREAREQEGPVVIPPQVDYDFSLELEGLVEQQELGILLEEFHRYSTLAAAYPGQVVTGKIYLGAPADEYMEPSEEAKRLSEIGWAIEGLAHSISTKQELYNLAEKAAWAGYCPAYITYPHISYYHVDVIGSGRFIYPEEPEERYVFITQAFIDASGRLAGGKVAGWEEMADRAADLSGEENRVFLRELVELLVE